MLEVKLAELGFSMEPCGSRVTCDPAPAGTDADYLVAYVGGKNDPSIAVSEIVGFLSDEGFKWEGDSEHYQNVVANGFMSWRKGDVNLIVSAGQDFCARHRVATALCKRLNLQVKADRIALFQAFLYGNV